MKPRSERRIRPRSDGLWPDGVGAPQRLLDAAVVPQSGPTTSHALPGRLRGRTGHRNSAPLRKRPNPSKSLTALTLHRESIKPKAELLCPTAPILFRGACASELFDEGLGVYSHAPTTHFSGDRGIFRGRLGQAAGDAYYPTSPVICKTNFFQMVRAALTGAAGWCSVWEPA